MLAYSLDEALWIRLIEHAERGEQAKRYGPLPADLRYEGPADWRPLHDPQRQAEVRAAYRAELIERGLKVH